MKKLKQKVHDFLSKHVFESLDAKNEELRYYYETYANNDVKNALWIISFTDDNTPASNELKRSIARAKVRHKLMIDEHVESEHGYLPKWYLEAKVKTEEK